MSSLSADVSKEKEDGCTQAVIVGRNKSSQGILKLSKIWIRNFSFQRNGKFPHFKIVFKQVSFSLYRIITRQWPRQL